MLDKSITNEKRIALFPAVEKTASFYDHSTHRYSINPELFQKIAFPVFRNTKQQFFDKPSISKKAGRRDRRSCD